MEIKSLRRKVFLL